MAKYVKKENPQNNGGRPKKEFDQKTFEGLCQILCTKDEICNIFECNEQTLTAWCQEIYGCGFCDIYKKLSDGGKASLRRMQFKSATNGNVTMQIWLGKQYLGQSDKQELTGKDGGAIEIDSAREQVASKLALLKRREGGTEISEQPIRE